MGRRSRHDAGSSRADALGSSPDRAPTHGIDPAPRASATRSCPRRRARCWRTPMRPVSRPRDGRTFPRRRATSGVRREPRVMRTRSDGRIVEPARREPFRRAGCGARDIGSRMPLPGLWATVRPRSYIRHGRPRRPHDRLESRPTCRRHHRAVTRRATRSSEADGELRFRRPDGRPSARKPAPACGPRDPVADATTRHEECGLESTRARAMPGCSESG